MFSIKPITPRAVSFSNLTVELNENKDSLKAFMTIYTPSIKWVKVFHDDVKLPFEGKISFKKILLDEVINYNRGIGSIMITNSTSPSIQVCNSYTVYELVELPCNGLTANDTHYLSQGESACPSWGTPQGARLEIQTRQVTECSTIAAPSYDGGTSNPGGSGESSAGSGGSTTPTIPGDYNPCDSGGGETTINSVNGMQVLVADPSECDPNNPSNPSQTAKQFLMQYIPISDPQIITKLGENDDRIAKQFGIYLSNNGGLTPENKDFINWASNYVTYTPNVDFDDFKQEYLESIYPSYQFESEVQSLVSLGSFTTLPSSAIAGLNELYTNSETTNIINNFNNEITGDPIELYMIACYKGSKLLNLSTYSISSQQYKVGDYYLTPHFDANNHLVFYSAFRNQTNGIEMIIRGDAVAQFIKNYKTYKAAANLFYLNGEPSLGQIQIASGDYLDGLMNMWGDSLKSPEYYVYVANIFVATATNLQTVSYKNITKKNARNPNYRIDSHSWQEYKNAISSKNGPWQPTSNPNVQIIENNGYKWSARPNADDWYYGYTIDFSKNNNLIGKFRFTK